MESIQPAYGQNSSPNGPFAQVFVVMTVFVAVFLTGGDILWKYQPLLIPYGDTFPNALHFLLICISGAGFGSAF